jgi:hypothetical protein
MGAVKCGVVGGSLSDNGRPRNAFGLFDGRDSGRAAEVDAFVVTFAWLTVRLTVAVVAAGAVVAFVPAERTVGEPVPPQAAGATTTTPTPTSETRRTAQRSVARNRGDAVRDRPGPRGPGMGLPGGGAD